MPANAIAGGIHHQAEFGLAAHAVPAAEAQQQAQVVDLEQIREIGRILAGEQLVQILKENLAGHVNAEEFFLQGACAASRQRVGCGC